jgi:glycosyltransferase involved in cell wall biosynthesis
MLARGLVRRGVPVEVLTTNPSGRLAPVEELHGVVVRRFRTLGPNAIYFVAPGFVRWLARHANRFALLHAHSYHTPLALHAAMVGRWAGVPMVFTPHYHGTGHSFFRRGLHLPYRLIGSRLIHQAGRVICVSEIERKLIHQHFGANIPTVVVPNGVDLDEIMVARPRDRKRGRKMILTVGRLEAYKQVHLLIEAARHLPAEYEIVIVGDGPERAQLERLAAQAAPGGRVRVLGPVSQGALLGWYRSADIFVSMSRREAFGLTVLEAAVAGAAIVASDIPAHREVAAYMPIDRVTFANPDSQAIELARVISSARLAGGADPRGWPIPSWDGMAEEVWGCYRDLLGPAALEPIAERAG